MCDIGREKETVYAEPLEDPFETELAPIPEPVLEESEEVTA